MKFIIINNLIKLLYIDNTFFSLNLNPSRQIYLCSPSASSPIQSTGLMASAIHPCRISQEDQLKSNCNREAFLTCNFYVLICSNVTLFEWSYFQVMGDFSKFQNFKLYLKENKIF